MLAIRPSSQFKKDLKKAKKQGRNIENLKQVLSMLAERKPLPPVYKDHKLKGDWQDFHECHIESDWLLIYLTTDTELRPVRVGTHSELFG